jgi:phosphate transport system permease protein
MSIISLLSLLLLVMIAGGFYVGRAKAVSAVGGVIVKLHSLPNYYGYHVAIWTGLPAFLLLAVYGVFGGSVVEQLTVRNLESQAVELSVQLEADLAEDDEFQALTRSMNSLQGDVDDLKAEIGQLRRARDTDRDPEMIEHLRAQQIDALNLATAAEEAQRTHRGAAVDRVLAGAVETGVPAAVQAGYVLAQESEEGRQLLIGDARRLANGELASRDTPQARAAAELMVSHQSALKSGAASLALLLAILGLARTRAQIQPDFRARSHVERLINAVLFLSSVIAILTTVGIVLSLLFESIRFFSSVSVTEFLFGMQWSPQIAIRADQVGQSGAFGAVPLFAGTAMITLISMIVAVPIGLFAAIYLSEYAGPRFRQTAKPILEILAGIPTVVFGFFALLTVGPAIRVAFTALGFESVVTQSALSAGLVMGIMIIPFISSLSDDVINAVPQTLRDGAYAMGATRSETITQVVLPAALPGIVGAVLLAVSRAIGETMIVVMAAGQGANLTANPLEAVTTITVQIVTLLTGDQEFDSPKTLSAFALALVLFLLTLMMNMIAQRVVQKYREKYD